MGKTNDAMTSRYKDQHKYAICTIIAANYISFARILSRSFRKHNPDVHVFILLVDNTDITLKQPDDDFELISIDELMHYDILPMLFHYNILEVCTALKPLLLSYLFKKYQLHKLAYVDPDILFTDSIGEIWDLLDEYSFVLTPHLTQPVPIEDECKPGEPEILRSGTYNLGFIALSNNHDTKVFLTWWGERLRRYCVREHSFLFVDQKWIDLIPGYYDSVYILRNPAYNVAYWNLCNRDVVITGSHLIVSGIPLKFFHFSGLDVENINSVSKYQDRFTLKELPHLKLLFQNYAGAVLDSGYKETKGIPYAFDYFDNGVKISEFIRKLYLSLDKEATMFGNPFTTGGNNSYFNWLNAPADISAPSTVTNLWYKIYLSRDDLQIVFPHVMLDPDQIHQFIYWCIKNGAKEHDIAPVFIRPLLGKEYIETANIHKKCNFVMVKIINPLYRTAAKLIVGVFHNNQNAIEGIQLIKQGMVRLFMNRKSGKP